jgi:site-specific DNA-cytosine methylase
MVLGALRPDVFLFENVQHFQSTVKADGVEFQATEVLAEAIANMSDGAVSYGVSSRVLDASRHGIPQTRQRYFMSGVRVDDAPTEDQAEEILRLRRMAEVTLGEALAGLPKPDFVGGDTVGREGGEGIATVRGGPHGEDDFADWIRRAPPGGEVSEEVDGHIARSARADDAAFFALMGPGKRWMDYRADDAPTVEALRRVLDVLCALPKSALADLRAAAARGGRELPDAEDLDDLRGRVDGSLSLRLLLEQAGEKLGSPHHLLTETYLAKRDGHHGDWVARMDAGRPSKTMVSHMGKDTYGYVHPSAPRTISVREAARVQTFPDWFSFGGAALTDAFKMVGNAVPPLLSHGIAVKVADVLAKRRGMRRSGEQRRAQV